MKISLAVYPVLVATALFATTPALASDLDDGISKYTDESIEADDKIGDPDKNIKYIITKAKAQAAAGEKSGSTATGGSSSSSSGNMNSVVMGAGSKADNIYIIDQSKGDKYNIVE